MKKQYHLVGIGGIGMSGIAKLLLHLGYGVSGSDLKENKVIFELKRLGAKIYIGHSAKNLKDAEAVIYSSAIKEDNLEIREARKLNIPLIMRAEALAQLMQDKSVITVAGSHGKTTTTSLVSCLLLEAGLSPTVAIGGILKNIDTNACIGTGNFFVAEADESDGSFLNYKPDFSIITNIDHEHLDYYKSFENEVDAFSKFINSTSKKGCLFYCSDDPVLNKLALGYKNKCIRFGLSPSADIYPQNITLNGLYSEFDCFIKNSFVARFNLSLGGKHNISNALSVIALGLELGISLDFIKKALSGYRGAGRRLEVKFKDNNFMVIDDYAHHPTEIRATLSTLSGLKSKRVIAIFQPHRFTRTKLLFDEFTRSFNGVDKLIITDIYAASELPIKDINSLKLCAAIKDRFKEKDILYIPKEEIVNKVLEIIKPGDLVITLGAGDIVRLSDELAERLQAKT
jgi:UDP-N-acetylmuramate--alanine ligase